MCNDHPLRHEWPESSLSEQNALDDYELDVDLPDGQSLYVLLSWAPIFMIGAIAMLLSWLLWAKLVERRRKKSFNSDVELDWASPINDDAGEKQNLDDSYDCGEITSGSGSRMPMLNQRTFANEIQLEARIGAGRYGEVWKGLFKMEPVAVKIFISRDEASWMREKEIYSLLNLADDCVLTYIGSDVTAINSCTQLWLVTAYHELGSLYDYLSVNTFPVEVMFQLISSLVKGVHFLHRPITGSHGKPPIAHRDLKSKNILMCSDRACCIADFGLAVTPNLDKGSNYRVGTKRYMAPEVLDGSMKENDFQSFTKADIYSLALVLWEIVCRTQFSASLATTTHPQHYPYMVPYQGMVPNDPSFEDMNQVVCCDHQRPSFPREYHDHEPFPSIIELISESWSTDPGSRLSALRIKKSLIQLYHAWRSSSAGQSLPG